MTSALDLPRRAACQQDGQVLVRVHIAVAQAASVDEHRVIQQVAIAVRRGPQPVQVVREHLDMMRVDLGELFDLLPVSLMMRDSVMRIGNADRTIRPVAAFPADHDRDHAREVRLERDHLKIEHQLRMILERARNTHGPLHHRQFQRGALLLRQLDAPLDVANRVHVIAELAAIARAEARLEMRDFLPHRIENAAVFLNACDARPRVGALAVAEQPLEHRARIDFHRHRRGRRTPRNRVGVGAAIARVAVAHQTRRFERQLQRRQLGLLAKLARRDLIDRNTRANVDPFSLLRMYAGQECGARARVVARSVAQRITGLLREPGQDKETVLERSERVQSRSELEAGPLRGRRPTIHDHAVRNVDETHAAHRPCYRALRSGERRRHRIQQRQGQCGSQAAQERAARQRFLRDDHWS